MEYEKKKLEELHKRISELNNKKNLLIEQRDQIQFYCNKEKFKHLIGTHYKRTNRYSKGESWFVYLKILSIDKYGFIVFSFQKTNSEIFEFKPTIVFYNDFNFLGDEITQSEYLEEYNKLLSEISQKVNSKNRNGHI